MSLDDTVTLPVLRYFQCPRCYNQRAEYNHAETLKKGDMKKESEVKQQLIDCTPELDRLVVKAEELSSAEHMAKGLQFYIHEELCRFCIPLVGHVPLPPWNPILNGVGRSYIIPGEDRFAILYHLVSLRKRLHNLWNDPFLEKLVEGSQRRTLVELTIPWLRRHINNLDKDLSKGKRKHFREYYTVMYDSFTGPDAAKSFICFHPDEDFTKYLHAAYSYVAMYPV